MKVIFKLFIKGIVKSIVKRIKPYLSDRQNRDED